MCRPEEGRSQQSAGDAVFTCHPGRRGGAGSSACHQRPARRILRTFNDICRIPAVDRLVTGSF